MPGTGGRPATRSRALLVGGGRRGAWPVLGLAALFALDAVSAVRQWPIPVIGVLDEPAHLLTAGLVLLALPALGRRVPVRWVLLGAVVIDLDHIPLYLFWGPVATPGGRPVTHSLVTVLVLAGLAAAVARWRGPLLGLAAGVLLHLARDVAGGPGAPLLWPLDGVGVRVPYAAYAAVLVVVTAVAAVRTARATRTGDHPLRGPAPG